MEGPLMMTRKERKRKGVFERVKAGVLALAMASELLGLSYRQCLRSYKRYKEEGDEGLVHRGRGRKSNRRKDEKFKRKVLRRYEKRYAPVEMGPVLAAEKLAEDGFAIHRETLRRWLNEAGLRTKKRRRAKHRSRRQRKEHFGELVQMDGSHHEWFGEGEGQFCLMEMVDDASGTTVGWMAEEETTELAMLTLWEWIKKYGVPKALYTDKKNVFVTDREPTPEEQLAGKEPKTAFGLSCEKLGVQIITAHSPQAKGRVERKHGVLQDRFVKELALRGIKQMSTANELLLNGFLEGLNDKFAIEPMKAEDYHQPVPDDVALADVFCYEESRVLQKDWTIRFRNEYYQILENNHPLPKPKDRILVRLRLDGSLCLLHNGHVLAHRRLSAKQLSRRAEKRSTNPVQDRSTQSPKPPPTKAPEDHPWRRAFSPRAPSRRSS